MRNVIKTLQRIRAKAASCRRLAHRHHKVAIGGLVAMLVVVDVILGGGAHASTQGPNAATSQGTATGWTSAASAEACDSAYATESVATGVPGTILQDTGYGFTIPAGSTITGIQVDFYKFATTSSKNKIEDDIVQLIVGGSVSGSNLATTTTWPSANADTTYGSTTSMLWGVTPTVSQINASNFGVEIEPQNVHISGSTTSLTADVDCVELTIGYSAPAISYTQSNYRFFGNGSLPSLSNGGSWTQASSNPGWVGRMRFGAVSFKNALWVMGGSVSTGVVSDIWTSTDGISWSEPASTAAWGGRSDFSLLVYNNQLWLFGGAGGTGGLLDDVWVSDDGINWTEQTASPAWAARSQAQALVYNGKMWIIGGNGNSGALNDAWYSTDGINWTQATACSSACFPARYNFGATVYNGKMWVMGGVGSTYYNDVYYSTDGTSWTQATSGAAWNARYGINVVTYNGYMWALGGYDASNNAYNTVYCSSDGATWSDSTSGSPACGSSAAWTAGARFSGQAVVYNNEIWEMGGHSNIFLSDVNYASMPGIDVSSTGASAQDTALAAPGDGSPFRLRMDVGVSGANLSAGGQNFILQYAPLASYGSCSSVPTANYSPVTTSSTVSYYQNSTAASGESLLDSSSLDPTESGSPTINKEDYLQAPATTTFTNPVAINGSAYGVWDFALTTYHALESSSYCIEVFSDTSGTIAGLTTYSQIPEITMPSTNVGQSSYRFYKNQDAPYAAAAWATESSSPFSAGLELFGTTVFNGNMYVLGGQAAGVATSVDDYSANGTTWTDGTASWSARQAAGVAVLGSTMYIMGGNPTTVGEDNDVYSTTNGTTWSTVLANCTSSCSQWSGRNSFVTLAFNNKIWVMGGDNGSTSLNDVWSSSNGSSWTEVTGQAPWTARESFAGMVYGGKMWIMGGYSGGSKLNDVWYSSDGVSWTEATANAGWDGRYQMASAVYNNQMYILTGQDASGPLDEVWHSSDGINWYQTASTNSGAVTAAGADSFNGSLWLLGGFYSGTWENDAYAYNSGAVDTGTPWANPNTPLDMTKYDSVNGNLMSTAPSPFRLRMNINMGLSGKQLTNTDVLGAPNLDLRLQYAPLIGTSCATTSGTWADVGTSTPIQWYTSNAHAANGNPLIPDANDPADGSNNIVYEDYVDTNYFGDTIGPVYAGQDGLWDFALALEANPPHTSYCLQIIYDNGLGGDYGSSGLIPLDYPQINVAPTMPQLLRGRNWWSSSGIRQYKDIK